MPEEIEAACKEIRKGWTPGTRLNRLGIGTKAQYEIPVVPDWIDSEAMYIDDKI